MVTIAHTKRAVTQYGDRAGGEGGQKKNMGGADHFQKKVGRGKKFANSGKKKQNALCTSPISPVGGDFRTKSDILLAGKTTP